MNFYKFHLGDYYKKTSHLSMLEDGAYRRLMDAIYLREGPLPAVMEQIYRLARAFTDAEKLAVDTVLAEFFVLTDAGYTNARCDEELESVRNKSEMASQSAQRRWKDANAKRTHKPTQSERISDGNASHKPLAISQDSSSGRGWDPPPDQPSSQPVTARHRIIAADLLDRAKADLSNWDRKFLTDLIGKATLSAKMQDILDGLAAKAGLTADAVMATWRKRLATARSTRQWDHKWGPQPGQPGCLAPDELLLDGDGNGWTRWEGQPATGTNG